MEDDLIFFGKEDDLIVFQMEDKLISVFQIEDNLNLFSNGGLGKLSKRKEKVWNFPYLSGPQFVFKWMFRETSKKKRRRKKYEIFHTCPDPSQPGRDMEKRRRKNDFF